MAGKGHQGKAPPSGPRVGFQLSKLTLAGTLGNAEDAPFPVIKCRGSF
jgi:hypothetical protein